MCYVGNPLKRLAPDLPGQTITSDLSITSVTLTLAASFDSVFIVKNKPKCC